MAAGTESRRLSAILSADVVGYSRLMAADEEWTIRSIAEVRDDVGRLVGEHHGRVVDFTGDNFLAEFPSAVHAVEGALAIQDALSERNAGAPPDRRMEVRIGGHVGDVRVEGERIFGTGVNIAARLESLADPGGLCFSRTLLEQVEGRVDLVTEDLGEQTVKNIPRPVHAFRIVRPRPDGARPERPATRGAPGQGDDAHPSIAVLPFENLSGDTDGDVLADGMTADVITGLSCDKRLVVIARNSTMPFKAVARDVREIGRTLDCRYVVEGSLRRMGPRLRVTAELVETATGAQVWAGKIDRTVEEIFDVFDEVTEAIITTVTSHLQLAEVERFRRRPPEELEAWALCTRALGTYFDAGGLMDLETPIGWVRRALEIDPDFAYAWAALAFLEALRYPLGQVRDRENEIRESLAAGERALQLAPNDPSSLTSYAIALQYAGKPLESISYLERSLRLNPNDVLTILYFGRGFMYTGRPEQAIAHFDRFRRLNPTDPGAHMAGMYHALALVFCGRWNEAEPVARAAIADAAGQNGWSWVALIVALAAQGRNDEAREALGKLHGVQPGWTRDFVEGFFHATQQDARLVEPIAKLLQAVWPA